jgi:lipoprotein-anchoring transpeptidase ErfK/SrfK
MRILETSLSRFSKLLPQTARPFWAAAVLALATLAAATPASAQSAGLLGGGIFPWEWNWGGEQQSNPQGRHLTAFPSQARTGQIIVSFADRKLYYVHRRGEAIAYPIAIPRPEDRWQGVLKVSQKRVNPPWTPTPSMRRENPALPAHVPGGHPQNPLGTHALYLGSSLYRIHGTDAPWTIGQPVSKGCVRMHNADVADLYRRIPVGTTVTVTWQSFYRV